MSRRTDRYAKALDDLDADHAAGRLTQGEYDVKRAGLLAQASKQPLNGWVQFLIALVIIAVGFVVLRLIAPLLS